MPIVCITAVIQDKRADLGFYKGGCPIHLKGTPERAKPPTCAPTAGLYSGDVGPSPRKFENLDTLRCIFPAFQGQGRSWWGCWTIKQFQ